MNPSTLFADGSANFQVLLADGERVVCRVGSHANAVGSVLTAAEHPTPANRLAHEYGLKEELDGAWAVRPLELIREGGRTTLVLEDPGGEPLERLVGVPFEMDLFLHLAVDICVAVGGLHRRGLLHKDIKPANIMVNCTDGKVRLTAFGIASLMPRERQAPEPPETIAGTLAYMAPEQTGRMNRSVDSRSDLYALGVTFYQMLTGSLPFTATDPMELVHCHIARQPLPLSERKNIPVPVSEIIMKLLAKTAEERYQTAAGVESDLRRCLAERERKGRIDPFALGEHDAPDRLLLPERLYGRAREIDTLLACFDRIVNGGAAELLLVAGYSGIGKSSVVNELYKVLIPPRGLFASGKFDQYKRDIPYSTLAQAFQSLIRPLLGKSDSELAGWREAFREALGPNGRLIIDLVPELKHIVGDQPPVPELPPHDAQRRFQLVFRRFLAVFARPEHPLALFLDDLQWLDSATLDLLEDLLTQPDVRHLILIGAYRDNEVNSTHPLIRKLEAIRKAGAVVHEIILGPLACEDLGGLIGDALHDVPERVTALAELIHEKTAGNPFFANQLISALVEEGFLTFGYGEGRWSWDLNSIRAEAYTDNVVDLLVSKLNRLPVETQRALQLLACMGNSADFALLEMASQQSTEEMHGQLWEAIRAGLIFRSEHSYRFLHDRVQEAAYSLIPEEARAEAHLRIGRRLLTGTTPEEQEKAIFEIVNQLNRGARLITSLAERERLTELNLIAGKRAMASTAYPSALSYFTMGTTLLEADCWERRYELIFALELQRAQCEFLTAELARAEQRLTGLSRRAANAMDRAAVASLRVDLHLTAGRTARAVEVGLDYLRDLGIDWSPHPTDEEARAEYERMWSQQGDRAIEDIVDMPFLADSTCLAKLEVLTRMFSAVAKFDANLTAVVVCRAVSLSLEYGNCDASCAHYAWLGRIVGGRFGDYQAAYRFGRLACDLVDRHGFTRFQAQVYHAVSSNVIPWVQHVRDSRELIGRAFDVASRTGNLIYEAYSLVNLNANMLMAGDSLVETQIAIEASLHKVRKMKFRYVTDLITMQLGYVQTLRGHTRAFASFDDEHSEDAAERAFTGDPDLAALESLYWIRVLQARFLAGDYAAASNARWKAEQKLWTHPTEVSAAEFQFYGALCLAAGCPAATNETAHLAQIHAHHSQLRTWERNCPANFESRAALVGAEIARIEGRETEAMRLYEQAIRAAEANGFVHHKAIACELAGYFYGARGFERIAYLYLRNAHHCYLHWGADAKVRQLERRYPLLAREEPVVVGPTSTVEDSVERLDLATVVKVSQAVSSEIVPENLIDALMRTAVAQAGAGRALLILLHGQEPRIKAEASTSGDKVTVQLVDKAVTECVLPESVLNYVLRAREIAILDDAAAQSPFGVDSYIHQRQARSILCLPLLNQGKLIGALYLENNLTPRVFASARISVLKLLASQAAISLENARLYRDVRDRERKIRRLVDSNIMGVFIFDFDGRVLEANDEFLRMVGYDRGDLSSIRYIDLMPPDSHDRTSARIDQHKSSGRFEPYEREYIRKDGSRVPVLIGAATFEQDGNQGVAFVLDLTERKRAEEKSRESELKLRQIIETLPGLVWSNDPGGEPSHVNQRMLDYGGISSQEFLRRNWETFVHPADYAESIEAFFHAIQTGTSYEGITRIRRADGEFRWHHVRCEPLRDPQGRIIQWYGLAVDIDERKRLEERLRVQYTVAQILAEAAAIEEATPRILQAIGECLGWDVAALWRVDREAAVLRCVEVWHKASIEVPEFEEVSREFTFVPGLGLPGRVWSSLEPEYVPDVVPDENFPRGPIAEREELHAAFAFPILLGGEVLGVIECFSREVRQPDQDLLNMLATIGSQIGQFIERKRAEDALRESERRSRSAIDGIGGLVAIMAANGELDALNRQGIEYFGRSVEEMKNWRTSDAVHPEDLPRIAAIFERSLVTGTPFYYELRLRRFDGVYRWFDNRGVPTREKSGRIVRWYILGTDIEDRKRAEEALRKSEAKFRDYAETASDWFWEIGPDYKFTHLTENAFGSDSALRIGTACWDHALDVETEPEKWQFVWAALDARESFRDFVYCTTAVSGTPMYVKASGKPIFDANGEFRGYRGTGTDVTALRAVEAEARENERRYREAELELAHANRVATMGQLTASITHEVNQPITAAVTYALAARRFLSAEPPNFREVDDALSLIVKEGNRAGDVVGRIRALIKKAPVRRDAVEINDAILEVIALTHVEAANNSVSVRTQLAEGLQRVQGDRVQLQQVVLNLIINAIEAMQDVDEEERELLVSTRSGPDGVSVEVRDSGPGFAPAALERVFEAFYTTKPDGLGLGLSICRSIIEAHNGRLWVSPNVPRGATFEFTVSAHPNIAS